MTTTVQMSLEEYEEMVDRNYEPSQLLMDTNANLLSKLDEAKKTIKELEASLSMYVSVGIKPRFGDYEEDEVLVVEDDRKFYEKREKPKMTGFTSKSWTKSEIDILTSHIGESWIPLLIDFNGIRTMSAIRSKLNKLGIRVKRGILTRED